MINKIGFSNVAYSGLKQAKANESALPQPISSTASTPVSAPVSTPVSTAGMISFKGLSESYSYEKYKTTFDKDLAKFDQESVNASRAKLMNLNIQIRSHFEGLIELVMKNPSNIELNNSLMKVGLKVSSTEEKLGGPISAKFTLQKVTSVLRNSQTQFLDRDLMQSVYDAIYRLSPPKSASISDSAKSFSEDYSKIAPEEPELPKDADVNDIIKGNAEKPDWMPKESQTVESFMDEVNNPSPWEGFNPKSEVEDLVSEVDGRGTKNLSIIRDGVEPIIVRDAGASMVKEGHFNLVKEFFQTVPQKKEPKNTADVFAKKIHASVVYDLASDLVALSKQNNSVKGFIESLISDKSITPAVKRIIEGAVQVKG